jgi:diphthamide synthase (EF-2-diphthine--ammonia ligase)
VGRELGRLRDEGIDTVAYGDLFLADVRAYREALMARNTLKAIYPMWGRGGGG